MGSTRVIKPKQDWRSCGLDVVRLALAFCILACATFPLFAQVASDSPAPARIPPAVGTIKSIAGNTILLANEAGAETKVQISPEVKYLRVPPGSKDLKEATTHPTERSAGRRSHSGAWQAGK